MVQVSMEQPALHAFTSALVGLPVSHIWRGYGSAICIEFGELSPRQKRDGSEADPIGQMSLMIEWSWRIEDSISIRCGSWSDEDLWPDAFAALMGSQVSEVNTFGHLPEVEVSFSNGMRILSFMTAEGLPAWTLFDRREARARWLGVEAGGLTIHLDG